MINFAAFLEGRRLNPYVAKRWENLPDNVMWEKIGTWNVLFHNSEKIPEDEFKRFKTTDRELIGKVIATLQSLGVRKHNRIPIIVIYTSDKSNVGAAYKSADDYLKVNRDMTLPPEQMVGTFAHEIGHAIYNKLPEEVYDTIRNKSQEIKPFTKYTSPDFVPYGFATPPDGHESGNEWFADYVAAITMKGYGLPANAMVADWEPNMDKDQVRQGMKATKQILGKQRPGRNWNKSAARENQKWGWLLKAGSQIKERMGGRDFTLAAVGMDDRISNQLGGGGVSITELLDEMMARPGGRIESMSNADRHVFMKTVYKAVATI